MSAQPYCSPGCDLIQNQCFCECPENMEPANEDRAKCVQIAPTCAEYAYNAGHAGALTTDPTFSLQCIKKAQAKDYACEVGFTEWQTGSCVLNCPAGLIENGLTCFKRPISRPVKQPVCENMLYRFNGQECTLSGVPILLGLSLFFVLVYLFFTPNAYAK